MSIFDLQRLEKATKSFTFPGADGKDVLISCHYPTAHELAAALCAARADIEQAQNLSEKGSQGLEAMKMTAKMGAAMEQLACYCIDSCSALPIKKMKDEHGIRRIDEATEETLSPILAAIGQQLFGGAEVSAAEGEV